MCSSRPIISAETYSYKFDALFFWFAAPATQSWTQLSSYAQKIASQTTEASQIRNDLSEMPTINRLDGFIYCATTSKHIVHMESRCNAPESANAQTTTRSCTAQLTSQQTQLTMNLCALSVCVHVLCTCSLRIRHIANAQ